MGRISRIGRGFGTGLLALVLASCAREEFDSRTGLERALGVPADPVVIAANEQPGADVVTSAPARAPSAQEVLPSEAGSTPLAEPRVRRVERLRLPTTGNRAAASVTGTTSRTAPAAGATDTIRLDFTDAPVDEVAGVILGDILNRNHVVDAGIDETISLKTAAPIARSDVVGLLSTVLASRNLGLTEQDGIYRIFRDPEGAKVKTAAFGVADRDMAVFPLRHISGAELKKVVAVMVPEDRIITLDGQDRTIIATGTAAELAAITGVIDALDVSEMAGMSSMLVTLETADSDKVAEELKDIFGVSGGASGVRVLPVRRLNAVVVMAPDEGLLDHAFSWIRRLDRAESGLDQRLFVYRLQHRRASDIVASMRELLAQGSLPTLSTGAPTEFPVPGEDLTEGFVEAAAFESQAQFVVDEGNNALIIRADAGEYRQIRDLLRQLDTPPLQVMIEALIIEVTLGDSLAYGVEYALKTGKIGGFGDSGLVFSGNQKNLPLQPQLPGFSFAFGGLAAPEIVIEALSSVTNVKVLSSPKLVVLDNQQAILQVGDSVPTIVQQATNTGTSVAVVTNSIEYRDTGITLKVTPRVNSRDFVNMDISQEVSDVLPTTTSTIDSPTIRQRKLLTSVAVQGGQTIMLGGLIQERRDRQRSGLPILMDIPLLGDLVSRTDENANRTELIALLTPHVISDPAAARDLSDRLRRKFGALAIFDAENDTFRRPKKKK